MNALDGGKQTGQHLINPKSKTMDARFQHGWFLLALFILRLERWEIMALGYSTLVLYASIYLFAYIALHPKTHNNPISIKYTQPPFYGRALNFNPYKYYRGRSISSLLVLACSFHVGFKRVSMNVSLTHGKTQVQINPFCQNRKPSTVYPSPSTPCLQSQHPTTC